MKYIEAANDRRRITIRTPGCRDSYSLFNYITVNNQIFHVTSTIDVIGLGY